VLSAESGVEPRDPRELAGELARPGVLAAGDPVAGLLAAGDPVAGLLAAGLLAAGDPAGVPVAGAGLDVQSIPKSGHATPDPQTPKMVPTTTKIQQTTAAMMTPVLTIIKSQYFFYFKNLTTLSVMKIIFCMPGRSYSREFLLHPGFIKNIKEYYR